ncbi:MAG TPA: tetratricopeptide repeat protein, partial [Nitrospirota bacterium]|nr:tetratricopeptide repeat protein [Nitrospirota bacterium]
LALLWGITALLKKTRKALKDEGDGVLAVGAAAGLGAFFAHAAVDTNVLEPALAIFALFMASLLVIISGAREGAGVVSFAAGRWTRPAAAAFGVVMAVYVTMPLAGRVYFDSYAASAQGGKPCGGDALRDLGRAVALAPGNASYRSALASCHFAVFMDKKDAAHAASALSEMDEAVRLSPKDAYYAKRKALALSVLGMAARDGGKGKFLAEAYGWYLKAIALYPSQPDSYLAAAGLAPAAGKADEVPRLLAGALEYEPDYLPARLALARFYLASGDLAGARAQLEKIKEIQGLFSSGDYDILTRAGYQVDGKEVDRLLMEAKKPG